MKKFDKIVNFHMLKLLEALPQDGGPVLDQHPSAPDEPERTTPQEKSNWEITLIGIALEAVYNVKNSPETLDINDEEKLGVDVTPENKEEMLNLLYKLAGKPKAPEMPIQPKPEPEPEQEVQGKEKSPEKKGGLLFPKAPRKLAGQSVPQI